jgi:hypothetical protein
LHVYTPWFWLPMCVHICPTFTNGCHALSCFVVFWFALGAGTDDSEGGGRRLRYHAFSCHLVLILFGNHVLRFATLFYLWHGIIFRERTHTFGCVHGLVVFLEDVYMVRLLVFWARTTVFASRAARWFEPSEKTFGHVIHTSTKTTWDFPPVCLEGGICT